VYRNRWHFYPKTFAEWDRMVEIARDYEKLAAAKGWAKGTYWTEYVGETPTEIIGEWDYPNLAALQQEFAEYKCPEMEEVFGRLDELKATRPIHQELLENVPLD
jgi:MoxR-like ATPase